MAVSVVLCASYLLHRWRPPGVLTVILLGARSQLVLGAPILAADAMLLFAAYNVAARADSIRLSVCNQDVGVLNGTEKAIAKSYHDSIVVKDVGEPTDIVEHGTQE